MNFLDTISKNPLFAVVTGTVSLVSFFAALYMNFALDWAILTITFLTLVLVFALLKQSQIIAGRMDILNIDILDTTLELEAKNDSNYYANCDIVLALHSHLTAEMIRCQPTAELQVHFPSQLHIEFFFRDQSIRKSNQRNDSCTFHIPIRSGANFISLQSIMLKEQNEPDFQKSSRKINFQLQCRELAMNYNESVEVSTIG